MRIRSHKFANTKDYIDTTYYNDDEKYLDIGYQMLLNFNIKLYPQINEICKLLIDHNIISLLPNTSILPHLVELSCSFNKLTEIPYYPKLTILNASNNLLKNLLFYENSNIQHVDVSFNKDFQLNIFLPKCEKLFMTDCQLERLELSYLPNLQFCDIENNKLTYLNSHKNLIELNIKNNLISSLLQYPSLKILFADYNKLHSLNSYENLKELTISYNKLTSIADQPKLVRLMIDHNELKTLGHFPRIKIGDLSYNSVTQFIIGENMTHCSLQFNLINNLSLPNLNSMKLKELQISFNIYEKIYPKIINYVKDIEFRNNNEKVEEYLIEYRLEKWSNDICNKFKGINLINRKTKISKLAKYIQKYTNFNLNNILIIVSEIYYKTLIINIYF